MHNDIVEQTHMLQPVCWRLGSREHEVDYKSERDLGSSMTALKWLESRLLITITKALARACKRLYHAFKRSD